MPRRYLILDVLADTVDANGTGPSVLTLPFGRRTFLEQFGRRAQRLAGGDPGTILVMPTFPPDRAYRDRIARSASGMDVRVLGPDELPTLLANCQAGESVVIYDAARWPSETIDPAPVLEAYAQQRAPLFVVGTGTPTGRAHEHIETDGSGKVKRIQRAYHQTAEAFALSLDAFVAIVPVEHLRGLKFDSVESLRVGLRNMGVAVAETGSAVDVLDLRTVDGMLQMVAQSIARETDDAELASSPDRSIIIDDSANVHETVRLVGPIIAHPDVVIGPRVTVVGPVVIGRGAVIEADAFVAHTVVAPQARIAAGVTLRHCVAAGVCANSISGLQANPAATRLRSVIAPPGPQWSRLLQLAVKRVFDVTASALGLLILSPLLVGLGIAIKLTSPGPLFFIHRRERADGKEFGCIKFRTMVQGAHLRQAELLAQNEVDGPQFKLRHDPRVTRLGAWMRSTNLDELPQLLNVLAGHMSIIGPRPSPFQENQICVPWRRARLSVRPGITGLWQICRSADRSAGDFHEWIFYDITYVRNFSLWLDAKILVATVLTLGGRNSVPIRRLLPHPAGPSQSAQSQAVPAAVPAEG